MANDLFPIDPYEIPSSTQAAAQSANNYATATFAKKEQEAADKLARTGSTAEFNKLDRQIGIREQNGQYVATDAGTSASLGSLGPAEPAGPLPSLVPKSESDNLTPKLRVKISQEPGFNGSGIDEVVFTVMPTISEARSTNYKSFTPLHHPGEILKFDGSAARSWAITAKLISRTVDEATLNLKYLNIIRTWGMPFYGAGTGTTEQTKKYLGAPPPILTLTAYGEGMIGPIKCVLESYNWEFPNDCDYIQAVDGEKINPFPVMLSVQLTLKESWSPNEFSNFDLMSYRRGNMPGAFSRSPSPKPPAQPVIASTIPSRASDSPSADRSEAATVTQANINGAGAGQSGSSDPTYLAATADSEPSTF